MRLERRLRSLLLILFSVGLVLTLGALFLMDQGSSSELNDLYTKLSRADRDRLEALMAEKGSDALKLFSDQVRDRRDGLSETVLHLASNPSLSSQYRQGAGNNRASIRQILNRQATERRGEWESVVLTDKSGRLVASWPEDFEAPKDLSSDPLFKAAQDNEPGLPISDFIRREIPPDKSVKGSRAHFESYYVVACGIAGARDRFAGVAKVTIPMQLALSELFKINVERALKNLKETSPNIQVMLLRGDGNQVFHSHKGPFAENFSNLGQDYKALMAEMEAKDNGRKGLKSFDGKPGLLLWKRVGAWNRAQGPNSLLTAAAFLPDQDFAQGGPAFQPVAPFWKRPFVLGLIFLAFVIPIMIGFPMLSKETRALKRTQATASQIDEFGVSPEGLEFHEEADPGLSKLNQALSTLIQKARTAENRVRELDAALKRVEDQGSRDATAAAQELSQLRAKLAGTEAEKSASNSKFDAALKARQEAEGQLLNLKSAIETSQRSIDLKNSEAKNLSAQVQDLMRMLEESRKVATQAQEGMNRREDELVRLSAVNTLASELKATLTVIKNYISTMLGSTGAISDAQQEFLGVVINKSARLERLIADLMELSEISSGIKPPKLEQAQLNAVVQEALLNTRPQADNKKIQLDFAESGQVPPVQVDKEKIGALLRALLAQAIKVTSRGEKVTVLLSGRENQAELRISDPGMSLPPDRAGKVFNQFHGVDSQAGPEFIGTGLRFPILRAVVESHGGKVWIESQVGRGKTFVLSIPKAGTFTPGKASPLSIPASAKPSLGTPPPPPPAAKPSAEEVNKFNNIFGGPTGAPPSGAPPPPPAGSFTGPGTAQPGLSPGAPKPTLPPIGGLPPLGTPPPPPPGGMPSLGGLPPLGGLPKPPGPPPAGAPPPPPRPATPPPPAAATPVDTDSFDAIFGSPKPGTPPPPPPPMAPSLGSGLGLPKVEPKTEAGKGPLKEEDKAGFDAIFGGAPSSSAPTPGALPKVELKTEAAKKPLESTDLAGFDAIFGGGLANAPKPVGPPPALGAVPPPPPPKPASPAPGSGDVSNFDAIFGGPAGPPKGPPPPPAGGLNTLDDLTSMIQGPNS